MADDVAMGIWIVFLSYLEWAVMLTLLGLSIWSIKIILERRQIFSRLGLGDEFLRLQKLMAEDSKWKPNSSSNSVQEKLLSGSQNMHWVRAYMNEQKLILEKDLSVLATLGANAPFIGLFGTVLGIIRAFAALGESSGSASSVMSGISQALYATAAGLFVAIPAVLAFNYFSSRIKRLVTECESLKDFWLARESHGRES